MSAVQQMLVAGGGDPFYNNVSLLLHFDGANGSTTFTDNSPTPKTVTAYDNAAISTTQSKFGGASCYFDGNNDYLTTADNDAYFLDGDFTIECWVYVTSLSNPRAIAAQRPSASGSGSNSFDWWITTSGKLDFDYFLNNNTSDYVESNSTLSVNVWTHVAVTRSGSTLRQFINGNLDANTKSVSLPFKNSTGDFRIGSIEPFGFFYNGYIDDFRLTKGVAIYTSNFTPPIDAFPNY